MTRFAMIVTLAATLAGCGSDSPKKYTVGGSVTGLNGSGLVLQNGSGVELSVSTNGSFTFPGETKNKQRYSVSVRMQPTNPWQTCVVSGAAGTVQDANVTNIAVACTTNDFRIGGTLTGLAGAGLVLQNNGGSNLTLSGNGAFQFGAMIPSGQLYAVTVVTQPTNPSQTCAVTRGAGTMQGGDVTDVAVACTTNTYRVGGTVSGLAGVGLVLQDIGANNLAINGNGAFVFSTEVPSGDTYNISVSTQPTGPAQTCTVDDGSGTVAAEAINGIKVLCTGQVAKFLYTTNRNSIGAYSIDAPTGVLKTMKLAVTLDVATEQFPESATADPAGSRLYVVHRGSRVLPPRISVFSIDGTGALTQNPGSPFDVDIPSSVDSTLTPQKLLVHPSAPFVYAALGIPGQIYGATTNEIGTPTQIPGTPMLVGGELGSGEFDAAGKFLYQAHGTWVPGGGSVSLYDVHPTTGVLTALGQFPTGGEGPGYLTRSPSGNFLLCTTNQGTGAGARNVAVFLVDPVTGVLTPAAGSPFTTAGNTDFIAFHPTKNFVYANSETDAPFESFIAGFVLDQTSGVLTPIAGSPFASGGRIGHILRIHPSGRFLYIAHFASNTITGFSIDQITGGLTPVPGAAVEAPHARLTLVLDPSGRYLYSSSPGDDRDMLYSYLIDQTTGSLTLASSVITGGASEIELVGRQ